MIHLNHAILALNPNIVTIRGDVAYDADENVVTYDLEAAQDKLVELQSQEAVKVQTQVDAKQTALNKLTALGLTEEEALALGK